jgi:hypothetical protein
MAKQTSPVSIRAASKAAIRKGFNPYDNHAAMGAAWDALARRRGGVTG